MMTSLKCSSIYSRYTSIYLLRRMQVWDPLACICCQHHRSSSAFHTSPPPFYWVLSSKTVSPLFSNSRSSGVETGWSSPAFASPLLTCVCSSSTLSKGYPQPALCNVKKGTELGRWDDFRGVVFLDVGKWWICRPCNTGFVIWDLPEKSLQRINLDIWDKIGTFWTVLESFRLLFYGNVNQIVKRLKNG